MLYVCFLGAISNKKDYCILAGDYNINLLNHETHAETGQFLNNIYAWSYLPVIIRRIRFTETSATLIDNIITNIPNESALTGILIAEISDHLPILYISKSSMPDNVNNSNVKFRRLIDNAKIDNFCDFLSQADWSKLYPIEDVNLCYDQFLCKFSGIYNKSFPIEKVKIKIHHNIQKPWITHGIIVSINNKDWLYKISI